MAQLRTTPACFGDRGALTRCREVAPLTDEVDIAKVARALAHPARIAIIEQFDEPAPRMTKELVASSGLAASTVTEHLRILREAGLVVSDRVGPRIWYCLCSDRLVAFARAIDRLVSK